MMTNAQRAKIFAPFDAMKGLQEALRDREERHLRVEKHDVSEEQAEQNSRALLQLERGMTVEVYCHSDFHDVVRQGKVTNVDKTFRTLVLDGKTISFEDIYHLRITDA